MLVCLTPLTVKPVTTGNCAAGNTATARFLIEIANTRKKVKVLKTNILYGSARHMN
jgi:hypothetical protein